MVDHSAAVNRSPADDAGVVSPVPPEQTPDPWTVPGVEAPPHTAYRTFHSATLGAPVAYLVSLPPGYEDGGARRYPVVYWLHGLGGGLPAGGPFAAYLREAILAGIAPPLIVVFPNGLHDSLYCDSRDGRWPVERVIMNDLLPHVDAAYPTIPTPEARAIEGHSMGGFGAARLGFKYPDLFGAVSISAGALYEPETWDERRPALYRKVFGSDAAYAAACSPWTIVEQNAERIRGRTHVRMWVGDQDGLLPWNVRFHEHLERLGIAHDFSIVAGVGHNRAVLAAQRGTAPYTFYAQVFGAVLSAPGRLTVAPS